MRVTNTGSFLLSLTDIAQLSKQSTSLPKFFSVIKPIFFLLLDRNGYIGWFCFL